MAKILQVFGGLAVLGLLAVVVTFQFVCPCTRMPGGSLSGDVVAAPVADWSHANDVPLCQLEVEGTIAWSINLNCMSAGGELFVSCSRCEGKVWSGIAMTNPNGRIRLGTDLHEVSLTRLTDPVRLDVAWQARLQKLAREPQPRPDHWWSFQLASTATVTPPT